MTDEEADKPVTRGDADRIITSVDRLTSKYRWTLALSVAVTVAMIFAGIAIYLGGTALVQLKHENACVASLAAASAGRTGELAPLSTAENAARDAQSDASSNLLFHAITTFGDTAAQREAALAPDTAAFTAAHVAYLSARDAFNTAARDNPPPKSTSPDC